MILTVLLKVKPINPPKLTVAVIYCILQIHLPMHYKDLHFERKKKHMRRINLMMAWKSRGKKSPRGCRLTFPVKVLHPCSTNHPSDSGQDGAKMTRPSIKQSNFNVTTEESSVLLSLN